MSTRPSGRCSPKKRPPRVAPHARTTTRTGSRRSRRSASHPSRGGERHPMTDLGSSFPSLVFDRPEDGILVITMQARGSPQRRQRGDAPRPRRGVARRGRRYRDARGHHPGCGRYVLVGRRLRPHRGDRVRLRGTCASPSRGARPRLQRHQLQQASRVGDGWRCGGSRPGRRDCLPTSRSRGTRRASSTATRASASPPATMPRSSGRCSAAWRRRNTTCCCASP